MAVKSQQSFGAFTSLVNKLALKEAERPSRSIVVLYGKVFFLLEGYYVRVSIKTTLASYINYHFYYIDNQLGRLVDNSTFQSRLFRLYLHVVMSHCFIDQLIGRPGTEEALYSLESGVTSSFVKLEDRDIKLLGNLARLTLRH